MVVPSELGLLAGTTPVASDQLPWCGPARPHPQGGKGADRIIPPGDSARRHPVLPSKGKPSGGARQRMWSAPSTRRTSRRPWTASGQPLTRAAASRQASRSAKARATSSGVNARKRAATASAPASA